MKRLLLVVAAFIATPAAAAAPVVTAPDLIVLDNAGTAPFAINKPKASSYTKLTVQTMDGTARAGVDYVAISASYTIGNNATRFAVPIKIIARPGYQGTRAFAVRITCTRNCIVPASYFPTTITINDSDPAPPPPPTVNWTYCAAEWGICNFGGTADVRYGANGTYVIRQAITGPINCDNATFGDPLVGTVKHCDTTAASITPPPSPPPTPIPTSWIAAPVREGGYARCKVPAGCQPKTGTNISLAYGEIVYLVSWGYSSDSQNMFGVYRFNGDPNGPYILATDLEGIAPAPGNVPPAVNLNYSIEVTASANQDCPGRYGRGGVSAGARYRARILVGGLIPPWPVATPDMRLVPEADPYLGPVSIVPSNCLSLAQ